MNEHTCCFTGHRRLPRENINTLRQRLMLAIGELIERGVTDFISGGALGFDQMAASVILGERERNPNIRLILALPCKDQDALWNTEQKRLYHALLNEADEVVYVSQEYTNDCMKKRNYYMVDRSAYCVCAMSNKRSGTGQTVRYALGKGLMVTNVMDESA